VSKLKNPPTHRKDEKILKGKQKKEEDVREETKDEGEIATKRVK
jgi:hypothetical protein